MEKDDLLRQARKDKVFFVQLWFSDLHGNLKRQTIPVDELSSKLEEGSWFDGSSVEGGTRIQEGDSRLLLDPETYQVIPWAKARDEETGEIVRGARIICDVLRPDGQTFEGDPRSILKRILAKAREMGFIFNVGPEVEFFLLKETRKSFSLYDTAGYFDATGDLAEGFRWQAMMRLDKMGIKVEMGHHEVAPSQYEIDIRYAPALQMADQVMTLKHVIERTARDKYGLKAVFMPKPFTDINGSGMHTHQSLFNLQGRNLFYDSTDPYRLSKVAYHFMAGQISHIKGLAALLAPTVNSYKRLIPGFEAPTYICWAQKNRSALIRIPAYTPGKAQSTRCEIRCPDPSCSPYLAFAVMLAAGLDGIEKQMAVPLPVEEDVYHFSEEELRQRGVGTLPGSLGEAIAHLERDEVLLEALGEHTAQRFLEAKKREWEEYKEFCGETESQKDKVTDWEIKKYLFGGIDYAAFSIKR